MEKSTRSSNLLLSASINFSLMPQLFTIVLSSLLFLVPLQTHVDAGEACYTSKFPTLMYHHIRDYTDDKKTNDISVSPEEFEAQIRFLAHK